jgi:hypothetical protein
VSQSAVLRAKYLDYCSARVAEVLLGLTADEIYVLAQEAARTASGPLESFSYEEVVRLATARLSEKLSLPAFETWAEAYREDPARFDRELIGLWESELRAPRESGGSGA